MKRKYYIVRTTEPDKVFDASIDKSVPITVTRDIRCLSKVDATEFVKEIKSRPDIYSGFYLGYY